MASSDYTAPPNKPDERRNDSQRLGFCTEMLQQATSTVESCDGYNKIEPAMRAIMGSDMLPVPKGRSNTSVNEIGRVTELMVADVTDTKPSCEYRTFNDEYGAYAEDFGKMWTSWFFNQAIDQKYGMVATYAFAGASGFGHQFYDKRTRDINVLSYDARDVRPVDPVDNTVQSCYGMHMGRMFPLTSAIAMFPHMERQLTADSTYEPPTKLPEIVRDQTSKARSGSPFWNAQQDVNTSPKERRGKVIKAVQLWWFYFDDQAVNDSSNQVYVGDFDERGDPITNYSYIVPPRSAQHPAQRLWPRKRLIVFSKSSICYDGPSPYWHGMFPVSKYTVWPLPWTWLGMTPIWDCLPLQNTITNGLRVWDDYVRRAIRPPMSTDKMTNEEELKRISEMIALPGAIWRNNPGSNGAIKIEEVPALDQAIYKIIEMSMQKIPQRCGVDAFADVMTKGQIPEGDALDKLMFAASPMTRLRSRMLELFYRDQGRMFIFNRAQYWSVRKKFRMLGAESLRPEDYLNDPQSFVPRRKGDGRQLVDVASEFLESFDFYPSPSSLLRTAAAGDRAQALALFRLGAIDPETLLEKMDYQNIKQTMQRVEKMWAAKAALQAQVTNAGGGGGGGSAGGTGPTVPQRPLGGAPQGRKPGDGAPHLRSDGEMQYK